MLMPVKIYNDDLLQCIIHDGDVKIWSDRGMKNTVVELTQKEV